MTYRSAEDALRERTRLLEQELESLERTRRETAKLDGEAARLQSTLEKSKVLLERFEQKRALPMLDQVRIASPCNASWTEMVGDDRSRYCGKCEKNVYNLSAMTREEAELLMLEKDGNLCVRLYRRTDGTVITEDCPVGVRRKRLRVVGVLAIGASALATAAGFAAAAGRPQVTQGAMEAMPRTVDSAIPEKMYPEMGDIAEPAPVAPKVDPTPPKAVMGRPSVHEPAPKKPGH
jgi:hypothetical protein